MRTEKTRNYSKIYFVLFSTLFLIYCTGNEGKEGAIDSNQLNSVISDSDVKGFAESIQKVGRPGRDLDAAFRRLKPEERKQVEDLEKALGDGMSETVHAGLIAPYIGFSKDQRVYFRAITQLIKEAVKQPEPFKDIPVPDLADLQSDNENSVDQYLKDGGDPDQEVDDGGIQKPLITVAAQSGSVKIVRELIVRGADIDRADSDGKTPLHDAVANGHLEVVKELVAAGADTTMTDSDSKTALQVAMDSGQKAITDWLSKKALIMRLESDGGRPPQLETNIAYHALDQNGKDQVNTLLDKIANNGGEPVFGDQNTYENFTANQMTAFRAKTTLLTGSVLSFSDSLKSALRKAIQDGEKEAVESYLKEDAKLLNKRDPDTRNTPLHEAVLSQNLEIVQFLVIKGAKTSRQNNDGETPRDIALAMGFQDITDWFDQYNPAGAFLDELKKLERPSQGEINYVYQFLYPEEIKAVEDLAEKTEADFESKDKRVYDQFTEKQQTYFRGITKVIRAKSIEPKESLQNLLKDLRTDNVDAINEYLADNGDPDEGIIFTSGKGGIIFKRPMLSIAASRGSLKVVRALLAAGADPNLQAKGIDGKVVFGDTPLHRGASSGNIDIVRALLNEAGIDTSITTIGGGTRNSGETPLHWAARSKHVQADVIEALLDVIDPNIKNTRGETALHIATQEGKNLVHLPVEALIGAKGQAAGIDINIQDNQGQTPLHHASGHFNIKSIEALIKAKPDTDIQDNKGHTALHVAALGNYLDTVIILAEAGADISIENNDGLTASLATPFNRVSNWLYRYRKSKESGKEPKRPFLTLQVRVDGGRPSQIESNIAYHGLNQNERDAVSDLEAKVVANGGEPVQEDFDTYKGFNGNQKTYFRAISTLLPGSARSFANSLAEALVESAGNGDGEAVKEYIRAGVDPSGVDFSRVSGSLGEFLLKASEDGDIDTVRTYLSLGADSNQKDQYGWTSLYYAAQHGHFDVIQAIVNDGSSIDIRSHIQGSLTHGEVALEMAKQYRSFEEDGTAKKAEFTQIVDLLTRLTTK